MSSSSRRNENMLDIYDKFKASCDFSKVGKILGKGAFGEVRDIVYKNKTMAGKLIKRENDEKSEEEKYGVDLRGPNIIKINKVYTKKIDGNTYDLIIMEKAILRDLGKLNEFYHHHNLLKLIYFPFDEPSGDCLLRFYARQIISALETLDRNYFVHYDIKPENLLISVNLIVKLSDFSLLTKIENGTTKIPGGTQGYLSPEYYIERNVDSEDARKQDYFALGSTLFFLKYGQQMLKYKKSDTNIINSFYILDTIQKQISFIESQQNTDKDFIEFLCSLINYRPKDRPSFEEIYRNKWLNKDVDYINNIFYTYENDEEKLIMELQKKDFLIQKEKEFKNDIFGVEDLKNENNNSFDKSKEKEIQRKQCRYRFKKKINH
jgi:serine/threonine protein kinase